MSNVPYPQLAERRILVVEDEVLVAMDLEDLLIENACEVLPTVSTVPSALSALARLDPEVVILDLNLDGASTLPVARLLRERAIPFVVVSGYGELRGAEPLLANAPLVPKPWNRESLLKALVAALPARSGG